MRIYDPAASARDAVPANPTRPAMAVVHDAPDARIIVFRIAAGQAVPVHTSASTVVLQVISGSGLVKGAEGERPVEAGALVVYGPREPHGMRATTGELVLMAVIAPRPSSRADS